MAGLFLVPQTLEILISPITDAVPEPSTWAMLLIGWPGSASLLTGANLKRNGRKMNPGS